MYMCMYEKSPATRPDLFNNDTEILPEVINVGFHTIDQVAAAAAAAARRTCIH